MVSSRELIYTGITRARSALTLVSKSASALSDGMAQTARRSSGLYGLLQEMSAPDGSGEAAATRRSRRNLAP
ncbi:MAG: hypothetical protein ABIN08_11835 [Caldimonas sp.]